LGITGLFLAIFVIVIITLFSINDVFAEESVPSWFKHVAYLWGNGIIDDATFLKSTEYLVNEGIIEAPLKGPTEITNDVQVPSWVKNNAGWWADGLISDQDFLSGIYFMIQNGIIGESTQASSSLLDSFKVEKIPTPVGLKVVWTNNDFQSHTITSGTIDNADEFFDSDLLLPNQPFTFVFKNTGSYPYFCMIHPWESATLSISSAELAHVEQEEQVEVKPEDKPLPSFVDPDKDPQHYINRYLTEPKYKEWFDSNYPEYTIYEAVGISKAALSAPSNVLSFETPITNPKDVHNSEFYNVNTECQLKYFFYKDPTKASEIVSLLYQSEQRVEQEYLARAGQYGDYGLMREIIAEIIMEQYSINPILKGNVIVISDQELPHEEIQQIQQGTHPCEEEFELYTFVGDASNLAFTAKTFFEDTPISGAEIGQWVKYQFEINAGSDENLRDLMNKQLSGSFSGANFDLDDVEWLKTEVIEISGNEITVQNEFKVRGKTSLFTDTITRDFTTYGILKPFIPTNVKQGNILFRDNTFGDISVVDFQKKNYGGKNIDTIRVMASSEYNQADGFIETTIENYYDKKTGMLLEGQMGVQAASLSESFDVEIQIKAIDFHIPSATLAGGGGCLIATATYGSELAPQVQQLREVRDNSLLQTESGRSFMELFNQFYYSFSPTIADLERENPVFKEVVKLAITPLLSSLSLLNYVDMDSEVEVLGYGISIILLNVAMYFVAPVIAIVKVRDLYKNRYERST